MKVCLITGPESTGKTSITERLSSELQIPWIPERSRAYLDERGTEYDEHDILEIAKLHYDDFVNNSKVGPILLDTYLLNLKIWSQIKYQKTDSFITAKLESFKPDLTLLMYPDIEWVADPLRESQYQRAEIFDAFEKELMYYNWNYKIVKGTGENRYENAKHHLTSHKIID